LLPGALDEVRSPIRAEAESLVDRLLGQPVIDGMRDIAHHLPETVVTDLVGLPEDGREAMLDWAAAAFDLLGIQNERGKKAVETIKDLRVWMETRARSEFLKPGSWTRRIIQMAEDGVIEDWKAHGLLSDYISPSLDTTISATGQLLFQLARNPDQWRLLETNPEYIPNAVNEAVRLSGAVRCMTRTALEDATVAGVKIPKGARVMVLFGCANRDSEHFDNADKFDVTRAGLSHVGFGHGIHMCVGMHLAAVEMQELVKALIARVECIEVDEPTISLNNTIYKFDTLPLRLVPRATRLAPLHSGPEETVPSWRGLQVIACHSEADGILELELATADGTPLADYAAGAHVDVKIAPGVVRQYSLVGPSGSSTYKIGVLKQPEGRGGSSALHRIAKVGATLEVGSPRSNFSLSNSTSDVLLFAGGIGITPLLAMAEDLSKRNQEFLLHYSVKSKAPAAFRSFIVGRPWANRVRLHSSADGGRLDIEEALKVLASDGHIYICGPASYMAAVIASAQRLGIGDDRIHYEYFAADVEKTGKPFVVKLVRTGVEIEVGANQTILEALEAKGIKVESSCLSGVCGTCATKVLDGVPEHRDFVLTETQKAANTVMTVCCSRSKSRTLTLDL
jgi:ferredoxin-NADP reductase